MARHALFLICIVTAIEAWGNELPTAEKLIAEAAVACDELSVGDDPLSDGLFALSNLASAYLRVGDEASARKVAKRIFAGDDKMLDASEQKMLETSLFVDRMQVTGKVADLPDGLTLDEQQLQRFLAARMLIENGRWDDALAQVRQMPDGLSKPRFEAQTLVRMAAEQAQREKHRAAIETLGKAQAAIRAVKENRLRAGYLLQVADQLVGVGQRQAARRLIDEIERTIHAYERDIDQVESSDYLNWSQLGHLCLALSSDEKAWQCYRRSIRRLDQYDERFPGGLDDRPENMSDLCRARAAAYVKAGRKQQALKSLDQAATWLARQGVTGDPDWSLLDDLTTATINQRYRSIAVDQYKIGDENAARATLKNASEQATLLGYRDMARHAASQGRLDVARDLIREILAHDNETRDAGFRLDIYTIASIEYVKLAERENAVVWFGRARSLSESNDNQFHPQLAKALIEVNFLELAYEMIPDVKDQPQRAYLLAKVALAAAKRDGK